MKKNSLVVKPLDSQSRGPVSLILSRSIKWVPGISGNLVVKSKLPPRSNSVAFRKLKPIQKEGP